MNKKRKKKLYKKNSSKWNQWKKNHNESNYYILTHSDVCEILNNGLNTTDTLLLALINSSDGNGTCFISDQAFAEKLHKSKTTIQHRLMKLRKAGLIRTYTKDKRRYIEAIKYDPYREHRPLSDEEWTQMEAQAESYEEPPEDCEGGGLVETA